MSRPPPPRMAKNILGTSPYYDQFFGIALDNLKRVLTSSQSIDNIQIEIKYAQFKYFSCLYDERSFKDAPPALKERIMGLASVQSDEYFKGLQMLSKQNIINLNPLGRNTYMLAAGFKQQSYRKFYHIRQFLLKMCKHNQNNNYVARPLNNNLQEPINIYHELSLNCCNHLLKVKEESQLRMDLYIKEGAPQKLRGRYSYSNRSGWKRTQKLPLCTQIDFMLNQRTFRFAINRQVETDVPPEYLQQISVILQNNPKMTDIRLKRLLRVNKGQVSEYALSEIYNINEANKNNCPDFVNKIVSPPNELNAYLKKVFTNFYSVHEKEFIKFQIQSQFTKVMTKHLKKLIHRDQLSDVKHELQCAIQQLYALFYCDHATKVKEMPWLNAKVHQMPETRLENQFGNYMRQELYEVMKNRE